MGQELLNRGVKPYGTLWGASALFKKKYHKIVVKTHLDFIKAGAEIIVTNSFGSRKRRLIENGLVKKISAPNVNAIDTTGAGDAFIGSFSYAIASDFTTEDSIKLGIERASDSVTKPGTQSSYSR